MEINMEAIEKHLDDGLGKISERMDKRLEEIAERQAEIKKQVDELARKPVVSKDDTLKLIEDMTGKDTGFTYEKAAPEIQASRIMRSIALAKRSGMGLSIVPGILRETLKDPRTADLVEKTMTVGSPTGGGYLVPEPLMAGIIPLLKAQAVCLALGARVVPMPRGSLKMRRKTAATTATYIGESDVITKTALTLGRLAMSSKKLAAIVPISNDLLAEADESVDRLVLSDLVESLALRMDLAFLQGDGTNDTPIGIKHTLSINSVTIGAAITSDDPTKFLKALLAANVDITRAGWAFNADIWAIFYNLKYTNGNYIFRDQMDRGLFVGVPFKISTQIATAGTTHNPTDIYYGRFEEMLVGSTRQMEIAMSAEAAYTDPNGNLKSALETDETLIRVIDTHDCALRQPTAFGLCVDAWTS